MQMMLLFSLTNKLSLCLGSFVADVVVAVCFTHPVARIQTTSTICTMRFQNVDENQSTLWFQTPRMMSHWDAAELILDQLYPERSNKEGDCGPKTRCLCLCVAWDRRNKTDTTWIRMKYSYNSSPGCRSPAKFLSTLLSGMGVFHTTRPGPSQV